MLSHYVYFCFYVSIVLCFIFTYSTVTGRKCEINIIVVIIIIIIIIIIIYLLRNDNVVYST